jgi:hypothetical protein
MRIIEPEVIKKEEKALFESIKSLFLFDVFCQEFNKTYKIELTGLEELNSGDIIVSQDQILFELNVLSKVSFAILIDRQGSYIGLDFSSNKAELADKINEQQRMVLSAPDAIRQKEKEIVQAISSGIESENIETLFKNEFNLKLTSNCQLMGGNLTIIDNKLAYRLNYTAELLLNLYIDMAGDLIELNPQKHGSEDGNPFPMDPYADSDRVAVR